MILLLLSDIWKSGADVVLDGENLDLINHENTPQAIIDNAIGRATEIEAYLKRWQKESGVNKLMKQTIQHCCGWQANANLEKWLCADEIARDLFYEWTIILAREGWSIYTEFQEFETDESNKLKMQFMELAKVYKKGAK